MHAGGLPSSFAGFGSGFLLLVELPKVWLAIFCKLSDEFSVVDFSRNFNKNASKNHPGGSPEAPRTIPARFLTHSANSLRILSPKVLLPLCRFTHFWTPWGQPGTPKCPKIESVRFFRRPGRVRERSRIEFLTVGDAKPVPTRFLVDFWTPPTLTKHCAWQQI